MSMNGDWKKLIRQLRQQGFEVIQNRRGGHMKVYQDGKLFSVMPATASDSRALRNQKATLRRKGVNV